MTTVRGTTDAAVLLTAPELSALQAVLIGDSPSASDYFGADRSSVSVREGTDLLRARGFLGSDGEVLDEVAALIATATSPDVLTLTAVQVDGAVDFRRYAIRGELGVIQSFMTPAVQAFEPVDAVGVPARLAGFVGLAGAARRKPAGDAFSLTVADLRRCEAELDTDDETAAIETLRRVGADSRAASGLVAALGSRVRNASVTVLHQADGGRLEGGTLSWVEGDATGIWVCDLESAPATGLSDDLEITVRPLGSKALVAEIDGFIQK